MMTTMATSFAGRIKAVNIVNLFALFAGNVFQDFEEGSEGQVADLAAPQSFHPAQVQGLKNQDIIAVRQRVGQFEEPVLSPVGYLLVNLGQAAFGLTAVMGALLFAGQTAVGLPDLGQRLLEKLGRLDGVGFYPIVDGQESLEAKIKPRHLTGRGLKFRRLDFLSDTQIEIPQLVSFERDRLDWTNQLPVFGELVDLASNPDAPGTGLFIRQELVASLFQGEALVVTRLLETRRSDLDLDLAAHRFEEQVIAFLDTLDDILEGLRRDVVEPGVVRPLFEMGQVFHQGVRVQMFAGEFVVPFVQGNTVIVGSSSQRGGVVQVIGASRLIQAILRCDQHPGLFLGSGDGLMIAHLFLFFNYSNRSGLKPCRRSSRMSKTVKPLYPTCIQVGYKG